MVLQDEIKRIICYSDMPEFNCHKCMEEEKCNKIIIKLVKLFENEIKKEGIHETTN